MRVTIASRRSELARIQAYQVGDSLQTLHSQLEINYSFHESLGDRNQNDPLWQMPEKGVFTQDFREGLLRGDFDLVVHSWKDLAIEEDPETEIAATLPRADARDLLLVREERWPEVARSGVMTILTSSPRRSYNLETFLRHALPVKLDELNFGNVRGNVPTRVRKLFESEGDGLIVAKAAIDRLLAAKQSEFAATQSELWRALSQCKWMVLPLRENPSAPAQGALAIEIVRRRADMRELLAPLNCPETFAAVSQEREILRSYGGGCHQKIGVSVLGRPFGEITFLRGLTDDGQVLEDYSLRSTQPRPPKTAKAQMWPLSPFDADWFTREQIPGKPAELNAALWIAKADALPDDWSPGRRQIVWISGVRSWKRLARRGIWVNGCAESLGEQEPPNIEVLAGRDLTRLKLTHADGYNEGAMPVLATYRLVPKEGRVDLEGKSYFFLAEWIEFRASSVSQSLGKVDDSLLRSGKYAAHPERNGVQPHVFLDHAQWLKEMSL